MHARVQAQVRVLSNSCYTADECEANGDIEVWDERGEEIKVKKTPEVASDMNIEQAREILKKAGYLVIVWTYFDIIERAKQLNITLSKKRTLEIREAIERTHDATIGVNWDVIDAHIQMAVGK